MRFVPLLCALVFTGLVAGCASPDSRIKQAPAAFNRLSPETQELVKQGKVGVGFSEEAVLLAVGAPDRKWRRVDKDGEGEIWHYTRWATDLGDPLYTGWYHRYAIGPSAYYLNYPARREQDYLKVVFHGGKVTVVEQDSE